MSILRVGLEPHNEVKEAVPNNVERGQFTVTASDVEMFEAFSVAEIGDALLLMQSGIKDKTEISGFLKDHGAGHLVVDRKQMMDEALQRRIDPAVLATFHNAYNMNEHPSETFLDAVEAYSSGTLKSINPNIGKEVLEGKISLSDIKTVGISRIHKSNAASDVLRTLSAIHEGAIDCTPDDVRKMLDTHTADNTHSDSLKWALSALYEHGGSFMGSLHSLSRSHQLVQGLKLDKFGPESLKNKRRGVLQYNDALMREGATIGLRDFSTLYHSGIDPHKAGRLWASGLKNVNQIIATETEDINPSIATGWL